MKVVSFIEMIIIKYKSISSLLKISCKSSHLQLKSPASTKLESGYLETISSKLSSIRSIPLYPIESLYNNEPSSETKEKYMIMLEDKSISTLSILNLKTIQSSNLSKILSTEKLE